MLMYCMFDRDEQCFSDCDNCVRNNTVTCKVCGESFPENEVEYYGVCDGPICQECLERESEGCIFCDRCGNFFDEENIIYTDDGEFYCFDCYKSIYER